MGRGNLYEFTEGEEFNLPPFFSLLMIWGGAGMREQGQQKWVFYLFCSGGKN